MKSEYNGSKKSKRSDKRAGRHNLDKVKKRKNKQIMYIQPYTSNENALVC